jgi:hypothetical protein
MDAEPGANRRRLIETLFSRAADLNPAERASLLDSACGTDAAMRSELSHSWPRIEAMTGLSS